MTQQFDPGAIKEAQRTQWGRAAAGWRQHDERFRRAPAPGAQRPARIVGPVGHVLATDLAPEMLEVARELAEAQGVGNVEFRLVDGEELDVDAESFDAATCRWGI